MAAMCTRRSARVLSAILVLTLAACASPASPDASATTRVVAVTTTDALRFEPDDITVMQGETVRFEVTNAGNVRHELYIGDAEAQAGHEAEMREMGGMAHDEPDGISVDPGQTEVLEHTFAEAGTLLMGCHEPGHYEAGMVGTIAITP
jgi:uncharacterized cupredoxin-like copper-binding protein